MLAREWVFRAAPGRNGGGSGVAAGARALPTASSSTRACDPRVIGFGPQRGWRTEASPGQQAGSRRAPIVVVIVVVGARNSWSSAGFFVVVSWWSTVVVVCMA